MIVFEPLLVMNLSTRATALRKRNGAHVVKHGVRISLYMCIYIYVRIYRYAIAVGDTTKACFTWKDTTWPYSPPVPGSPCNLFLENI